jgi:hypothetical protein
MDLWMDVVDDEGVSRAMDSFEFYCLLQGWGGLEYYPTYHESASLCDIEIQNSFSVNILSVRIDGKKSRIPEFSL